MNRHFSERLRDGLSRISVKTDSLGLQVAWDLETIDLPFIL